MSVSGTELVLSCLDTNGEDVFLHWKFTDGEVISALLVVPVPLWLSEDFGG